MRASLLPALLALAGSTLILPPSAAAQGPSAAEAAARLRLATPDPMPYSSSLIALPDSVAPKRKDHTVTGLLIGGGLGFLAGWAFYDVMCEAVDNNCSDSPVGLVVLGTATGGMLGALIGSLSD